MSEFIPTQEEKDALSYLDWDDAALGRFTKHVACTLDKIRDDAEGLHRVMTAAAAMALIGATVEANADRLELNLDSHTHEGVPTGDWKITVERIRKPVDESPVQD